MYRFFYILIFLFSASTIRAAEPIDLRPYEKRIISQFGEDGVIQKIFKLIGTTSQYYVEFGAGGGHFWSNTKYLREKFGWKGLMLDGGYPDDPSINLHREFITAENICELFAKYGVPEEFDLISIDIDGNDFYVWKELAGRYRPRVVVIECCTSFNYDEDKVIKYNPNGQWDGTAYYGSSVLALYNLGIKLGYTLVYHESAGINLFFIRNDVLESSGVTFKNQNDVSKIYAGKPTLKKPARINTEYCSSSDLL